MQEIRVMAAADQDTCIKRGMFNVTWYEEEDLTVARSMKQRLPASFYLQEFITCWS